MAKVSNIMATKVALDMVEASTSVRNLTTVVNSATQAWKANEANMRSAGDYAGAAKAKYEGLGDAISAQRDKIEALERKQSEMNTIDKEAADQYLELRSKLNEYREEMDQLDTTTEKGQARYKELDEAITRTKQELDSLDTGTVKSAEQFLKYGQEVDRAKAKLASLQSQQQRAAQQVDLENSGVVRLNATMRAQGALASATAERLRSEGQNYQAMTVEVNNLRSRLDTLRNIQQREVQLLSSTRARMGETSTEYMKQATRVQELGTKIQDTRSKIAELNATMQRTPTGWLGNVASRLDSIQGRADRVSTTFGRIFGATAAANLFTNALGSISARMGDLIKSGVEYNVEQNKMVSTWTTLTGSASKAKPMIDSINRMSKATGQSVDVVNELEQGFYHLNSSKSQADGMTSSLLNMADAVGLNGEQIRAVEQDMVHGMATGKITQGELNQISQYFPMIDAAMAKHFHTTIKGMRQMAKAGKITSKDLQDVFEQLGNGKYKKAAENMMNSYFGVFRTIRASSKRLMGDIETPFMTATNPILQATRKWINDDRTDKEFSRFGKHISKALNKVISAFSGSNFSTKTLDNALKSATRGVDELGDVISRHHAQISSFFRAFKAGSAAQIKIFAAVFVDLSKVLLPVLNLMARFPKTSAALVTGMLLASRAVRTLQAGISGFETLKDVSQKIRKFGRNLKNIPEKKTIAVNALTEKAQTKMSTFKKTVASIQKDFEVRGHAAVATGITNIKRFGTAILQLPKRVIVRTRAIVTSAISNTRRLGATLRSIPHRIVVSTQSAVASLRRLRLGAQLAATTSKVAFTTIGIGARAAGFAIDAMGGPIGIAIMAFTALYQHSAKFRKFCNSIVSGARAMVGKVGRWFGNMARTAGRLISTMSKNWQRGQQRMNRETQRSNRQKQRATQQMWNRMGRTIQQGWNRSLRFAIRGIQRERRQHQIFTRQVDRLHNRMWRNLARYVTQGWNRSNRLTRQGTLRQMRQHQTMSTRIAQFNANMWKNIQKTSSDGMSITQQINLTGLKTISSGWNSTWNNLRDFFSKIWDAIKKLAADGMNAVIGVIDGGIGAIDKVWSFFTGHGSGIGKLPKVHFAQGGVVHRSLAVVNDGAGSDWKELMHFPDGSWGMSQERNATLMLPVGTRVYNGEETKGIMSAAGIEHYANGGVVGIQHFAGGGFVRALENWVAGIGDALGGLGEKFRSMEDYLETPVQKVKGVIQNAVGGDYGQIGHWGELAHGEWDKITDGMTHWVRHTITDFLYSFENQSLSRDMMRAAATINKVKPSDGFFGLLWATIMSESGGRNIMQQIHDVNSGGNEAGGILQYTPGTFAKYALPGHGERMNDFNQLLAFFNNTDWLNSIGSTVIRGSSKIDWLHSGPQGGRRDNFWPHFADGGLATQPSIFGEAGAEMAIPLDTMKSSRAWQLMRQVVNYYAGSTETVSQSEPTDLSRLEKKFDSLLSQNQAMISLLDKLIGVTATATDPNARYKRTQRDINLAHAQSFV
ncbi:tape measure protein [Limosilactobacillus oris]|uniref:tape measure protein n=1 Tax=Limosilactobacillus oris TaxID=1632 RepID=UPI0024B339DA|nr:tape measure protein [Limosilactobacillus oris]WHO86468.1 tape measure protein [Limosilactobacillus oris]